MSRPCRGEAETTPAAGPLSRSVCAKSALTKKHLSSLRHGGNIRGRAVMHNPQAMLR